ncbi:hypothetical protein M9H77_01696 [Catharanthus roseus]|uniref:Uncharacterized protein n=1 Tax=Catharanthus roseus TaxID=4058 RepID=A0ACC0C6F2_CATRO|nr:hypothetical protein M9H77_01696 [Catharanthus roseus]
MKRGSVLLEAGADGVAIITIANPPFNLLSVDVMLSLKERIEEAVLRDDVKAIVLIGSHGKFSAGFDVMAFGGSVERKTRKELGFLSIDFVTDTLEASKKPIVAAIDGPAFGGGLEIALACHARISTASAQLGLTELEYGIIPGLGGTQRLPRLVGICKALEMLLMSKRVSGDEAKSLNLIDFIAPADKLLAIARQWALDILECQRRWVISLYKTDKLGPLAESRRIFNFARIQVQERTPNVTYPLICIDVVEEGIVSDPRNGLWKEVEVLQELRQSSACRSLVHIFFSQRRTTKIPGVSGTDLVPRNMKKIAVIGGGLLGSDIATALILCNYNVIMKEVNEISLLNGVCRVKENLRRYVDGGKLTHQKLEQAFTLLKCVLNYDSFNDVDLVIEAASQSLSLKQQTFAELEKYCPQHCIFSSNNCPVDLGLIGERSRVHNRIVGVNLFSPAPFVPLLELVCTDRTCLQVIVDLMAFGRKLGKTPVVVGNSTGFALNRMFFLYLQSAMLLVESGADAYQIDQCMVKFGMQFGPFRMIDRIGLQVTAKTAAQFYENFPQRSHKSWLIQVMQEKDYGGESNHKGFYAYDNKYKAHPDPKILRYIKIARNKYSGTINSKLKELFDEDIVEMVLFPVVNEACRLIADGIALKSSDLDVASVMGMGFPRYRGGVIFWADTIGSTYICLRLEHWSTKFGEYFKPCAYLVQRASKGYSLVSQIKQAKSQL